MQRRLGLGIRSINLTCFRGYTMLASAVFPPALPPMPPAGNARPYWLSGQCPRIRKPSRFSGGEALDTVRRRKNRDALIAAERVQIGITRDDGIGAYGARRGRRRSLPGPLPRTSAGA